MNRLVPIVLLAATVLGGCATPSHEAVATRYKYKVEYATSPSESTKSFTEIANEASKGGEWELFDVTAAHSDGPGGSTSLLWFVYRKPL
jgi:hypothetical protein